MLHVESNDSLLATVALICVGSVAYFHYKTFTFWSSRGIKGPTPWPIFGTNIYYYFTTKVKLELKWREQYGRTYGVYEGYSPLLKTTDNELMKEIFIKQFDSWTDRNCQFIYSPTFLRSMLWSKGHLWTNQRALVSPMFTASRMRPTMSIMSECIDRFVDDVKKRLDNKEERWSKSDLSSLTLDVIASSFFGLRIKTYTEPGEKREEFIEAAFEFAKFNLSRFLLWLFVPRQAAKVLEFDLFDINKVGYFEKLAQNLVASRRSGASKRQDVVQALIEAKISDEQVFSKLDDKEAHYNADLQHEEMEQIHRKQTKQATLFRQFEDKEIHGMLTFFFLAGFETTATTLSFAFYELSHRPEVAQHLYNELICKFGDANAQIIYDDLVDLTMLDAFVSELLRLYSPILDINRRVSCNQGADLLIDGCRVHLPKGVPVSTNAFVTHHDEDYFQRPYEFDMTRFLAKNKHKIKPATFMPFGIGPRHCVGMRFALMEIKVAIAKVLMQFRLEPAENCVYPPTFRPNAVFLQMKDNKFKFVARA